MAGRRDAGGDTCADDQLAVLSDAALGFSLRFPDDGADRGGVCAGGRGVVQRTVRVVVPPQDSLTATWIPSRLHRGLSLRLYLPFLLKV